MTKASILLVDDEEDILEFLGYNLISEGYQVFKASNGRDAIAKAGDQAPDLILLDLMMPDMDGIETCQELRKIPSLNETIISFLTARGEDFSQIAGLEAGADDYIVKPIKPKVLISKVKSMLRRKEIVENDKGLIIDRERYVVIRDGEEINLPKKEFELLSELSSRPGKVLTREHLLDKIWGDVIVGDRTVDVHIRKLREKIGEDVIKTITGVGYKFVDL